MKLSGSEEAGCIPSILACPLSVCVAVYVLIIVWDVTLMPPDNILGPDLDVTERPTIQKQSCLGIIPCVELLNLTLMFLAGCHSN